jgi:hypothetical protein|tara:strand:- start:419 stop:664 length:246 start_codon:yes stop_codon:yes gene_type:complete
VGKTSKNTLGKTIFIKEIYPENIKDVLLEGDCETLKRKYGDKPCMYEVSFPWKDNIHHMWFIDEIYERYGETHVIVRQKSE